MDIKSLIKKARGALKGSCIPFIKIHRVFTVVVAAVIVMGMLMSASLIKRNNIIINIDGNQVAEFTTPENEVSKWLELSGIEVFEGDIVETEGTTINITRAFFVTVEADGQKVVVKTTPCTVDEVLALAQVEVLKSDVVNMKGTDIVSESTVITVNRVKSDTVTKTETIEFETEQVKTDSLYKGETKVKTEGKNGEMTYTYKVTYTDGVETDRKLVSKEVTKKAVNEVVLVGTKVKQSSFKKTASTPTKYKKVYSMRASAYTYGEDGGNYTATGEKCRRGIVAVDPDVIPLGTKLYIESADGKYIYGNAVAADTGGSIKGMKIDIFVESESECYSFGRRDVNVYIIG